MSTSPSSHRLLHFTLARAHQIYLPLLGRRLPWEGDAVEPVSDVLLTAPALLVLRDVLELPTVRTGLLFGHRAGGQLSVSHITAGGYEGTPSLFAINAQYVLGVTDALRQVDAELDWVGQWLTVPSDVFVQEQQRLRWVELARAEGLVGPYHPLVMVGWREGVLVAHSAITLDDTGEMVPVRTYL